MPVDERELIAGCRSGDEAAMRMLFGQHQQAVYAMALRLTGEKADAQDVVQETFLKAFRHIRGFRGDASVRTWLVRIAINLCRDLHRKRSRIQAGTDAAGEPVEPERVGARDEPADAFARKRLQAALSRLPEGYREVLVMHDVMDMGHGEIAAVLGVAEGTSKSQLHKARARMREMLVARGAES
ncbi:MAG: sigma-70 family RNA polymerase sigma factor [Deltaproteobacteria bacterium]|nr:sigma-70 family RNA polymerase sigma factor [Deltaproteobacteria bacterium]